MEPKATLRANSLSALRVNFNSEGDGKCLFAGALCEVTVGFDAAPVRRILSMASTATLLCPSPARQGPHLSGKRSKASTPLNART